MNLEQVSALLVEEEGEVLHAYRDHLGYLTIGVGRLIDPERGGGISRAESRMLLANDIARFERAAREYPWFGRLDGARQGCVVCMMFQLGAAGFSSFRRMIAAIERGDYDGAALEMLDSRWARQTPARARRMAAIMRTGVWR